MKVKGSRGNSLNLKLIEKNQEKAIFSEKGRKKERSYFMKQVDPLFKSIVCHSYVLNLCSTIF